MESTSASTTHLRVGWSSEQEQTSPCNCNDQNSLKSHSFPPFYRYFTNP
jgi:hypothetical protein